MKNSIIFLGCILAALGIIFQIMTLNCYMESATMPQVPYLEDGTLIVPVTQVQWALLGLVMSAVTTVGALFIKIAVPAKKTAALWLAIYAAFIFMIGWIYLLFTMV